MEDVIYGVMLRAKMEKLVNPPPVNAFSESAKAKIEAAGGTAEVI